MNEFDNEPTALSRRQLLAAAGIGVAAASLIAPEVAEAVVAGTGSPVPPVQGLHLQFGADASSEIVVSWHTLQPVRHPRVVLGPSRRQARANRRGASDRATPMRSPGQRRLRLSREARAGCSPTSAYMYAAMHDGAAPEFGTFRTAPRGRAAFTFTSFGDQGTPTLGKKFVPPAGRHAAESAVTSTTISARRPAGDTTLGVERLRPLFHLFNGDLCYANLAEDRVRTWWDFWANNTPQRPQPPVDALGRQPRERAGQRADRLSGLSDLFLACRKPPARPM